MVTKEKTLFRTQQQQQEEKPFNHIDWYSDMPPGEKHPLSDGIYFQATHKCSHKECGYINESGAIDKGYLSKTHKVVDDDVHIGRCGRVHLCGNGGDLVSPCIIDLLQYNTMGTVICVMTNKSTRIPDKSLVEVLPSSQAKCNLSDDCVKTFCVSNLGHATNSMSPRQQQQHQQQEEQKEQRQQQFFASEFLTTTTTTTTTKKRKLLSIRDNLAPFDCNRVLPQSSIKFNHHNTDNAKQTKNPRMLSIVSQRRTFNKTKQQPHKHKRTSTGLKNNDIPIHRLKKSKTTLRDGSDASDSGGDDLVDDDDDVNDARPKNHIGVQNVKYLDDFLFLGNTDRIASSSTMSPKPKLPLLDYFRMESNVSRLNLLHYKANQNHLLGTKEERAEESSYIITKLFTKANIDYAHYRHRNSRYYKGQDKPIDKQAKCVRELYQFHLARITETGCTHIDILEGLAIIAKYYASDFIVPLSDLPVGTGASVSSSNKSRNLTEDRLTTQKERREERESRERIEEEQEELNIIASSKACEPHFVAFYSELCWLQWCVICASPRGLIESSEMVTQNEKNMGDAIIHDKSLLSTSCPPTKKTFNLSQQQQPSVDFTNCCLAVLYDMIDGTVVNGKMVIPKVDYISRNALIIKDITSYGFKKNRLTKGINQRTLAYGSLSDSDEFTLLCNFDFANYEKIK
jgi:hypothetical protein